MKIRNGSQMGGIYKSAFYNCSVLEDIKIPESVQEIDDYAFYGCTELEDVDITSDSALKGIFDYAFAYSGIKSLSMPDQLEEIGSYAFIGAKLDEITFNDCIREIGNLHLQTVV